MLIGGVAEWRVDSAVLCAAVLASAWLATAARLRPSRSVLPRVSPTLAAAEGHQRAGPSHPSWRVG